MNFKKSFLLLGRHVLCVMRHASWVMRHASCVLFLLFVGCATTGDDFNYDGVGKIVKNQTTKEEILKLFGAPNSKGIENGRDRWTYEHNKKYLGGKLYHKDLVLVFDAQGKVVAYSYESNFPKNEGP